MRGDRRRGSGDDLGRIAATAESTVMCGIIGYVGPRECRDLLLEGLQRLEYRGYDSAGLSLVTNGVGRQRPRRRQPPAPPRRRGVRAERPPARRRPGIGHTRWATHGRVTEAERAPALGHVGTRPHRPQRHRRELDRAARAPRERRGRVHLRDRRRGGRPPDRSPLRRRPGRRPSASPTTSCAATTPSSRCRPTSPACSSGARKECPLVVGLGEGESFIASAIPAFLARDAPRAARRGRRDRRRSPPRAPASSTPDGDRDRARDRRGRLGRGGRREGRLRDLHAEGDPRAGRRRGRDAGRPPARRRGGPRRHRHLDDEFLRDMRRVVIVACGTSYHAGLVGRYAIEGGRACPWRWTSRPSSATATRCSTSTTS